jgi:outer membrane protein
MRRIFLAVSTMAALVLAADAAEAQTAKFGYINSQEILANAPGATEAQQAFEADLAGYEQEAQELQAELTRMQQELEQQRLTLSPEARQAREERIRQKAQEAQQRMQELDQMAAQRRQELVQPVMDEISDVIEAVRADGNYAFVFDVAAGAIVAADPTLDLTDEVIRRLQSDTAGMPGGDR